MKEILIVGFGGIGSRHCESLISNPDYNISIIDPDENSFKLNSKIIDLIGKNTAVHYFKDLGDFDKKRIDLIIHATTANVRLDSLKNILSKIECNNYLLEKIVFQNSSSFREYENSTLAKKINSYVHLPMRYYRSTKLVREIIKKNDLLVQSIEIKGSRWGILCNLIHYLDYFKHIFGVKPDFLLESNNNTEIVNSKRSNIFKEISGELSLINSQNVRLHLIDRVNENFELNFICNNDNLITIKDTGVHFNNKFIQNGFRQFTSELTLQIVDDIFNSKSSLPFVNETLKYHEVVFDLYRNISMENPKVIPVT